MRTVDREWNFHLGLLTSLALIFLWSAIRPYDRLTWLLEVFPVILGVFLLAVTYTRFRFSRLVYVMKGENCFIRSAMVNYHVRLDNAGGQPPCPISKSRRITR